MIGGAMEPHPNDKQARVRKLRRELNRLRNYIPNTIAIDAMAKAALEKARERIIDLERELAYRDRGDRKILGRYE